MYRCWGLDAQQTLLTGGIQQGLHLLSSLVAVNQNLQVRRNDGAGLFTAIAQQKTGRHQRVGEGQLMAPSSPIGQHLAWVAVAAQGAAALNLP